MNTFLTIPGRAEAALTSCLPRKSFGRFCNGKAVVQGNPFYAEQCYCFPDCTLRSVIAGGSVLAGMCRHQYVIRFGNTGVRRLGYSVNGAFTVSNVDDSIYYVRVPTVAMPPVVERCTIDDKHKTWTCSHAPSLLALNHAYSDPLFAVSGECIAHFGDNGIRQFSLGISPVGMLLGFDAYMLACGREMKVFDPQSETVVSTHPHIRGTGAVRGVRVGRNEVVIGQMGNALLYDLRCEYPQCYYRGPHLSTEALYVSDDCLLTFRKGAENLVLWDVRRPSGYFSRNFNDKLASCVQMRDGSLLVAGFNATYHYPKIWE